MTPRTTKAAPRVAIDTCEGLMEKLRWEISELEKGWTEYRTFNFVVTAYHLYADWIEKTGHRQQRKNKGRLPASAKRLFNVLQDLTNASKHWSLDQASQAKQVVEGVSSPQIGDWYAYLIAGPVIYVTIDGARPSMPEIASLTMKCLDWILATSTADFPRDLEASINRLLMPT